MQEEVVILSGSRTAIGSFGGSLKSVSPIELGTVVAKKALEISEVDKNEVGQVAFGHVINTEPKDMYLSRVVALNSGLPKKRCCNECEPFMWIWITSNRICHTKFNIR